MMPDRDALVGEDVVVWGVTDQTPGTYELDCGNGVTTGVVAIADRSYIPLVCNYGAPGTYTATLTTQALGESDTAAVSVFDGAALTPLELRGLQINMAIEDGLRNLWVTQTGRAAGFPTSVTTFWGPNFQYADTSMTVLAFENQGYGLTNDNVAPTGIYEKYIVRRGLNYVMSTLSPVNLGLTPQGDDPCVAVSDGPAPCVGLTTPADPGYSVGVAMLGFAGSGALARTNTEVAGVTAGMTFGEILQRLTNALAWGQQDAGTVHRGGWIYSLNGGGFDGSTVGWALLAFLDAAAAGATVPPWVATEFQFGFDNTLNTNGSFDYRADGNPAGNSNPGPQKVGIGLQGLFFTGEFAGARVTAVTDNINSWWNGPGGIGVSSWTCSVPLGPAGSSNENKGCTYSMFNNFKGLKLHGIQTLPNVGRAAGPGAIPANDWHEDYKDWLLANQNAPTTVGGGSWGPAMGFSCCGGSRPDMETAIAELMLSPVALVLPDPVQFGEIGLQHCLDGVPCTSRTPEVDGDPTADTNPVGTDHTVVARALSVGDNPIPGTTIDIDILSGPNAPQNFQGVSNAQGEVKFTYTSDGTVGTDEIQASIGNLNSNLLTKIWEDDAPEGLVCDVNTDNVVDRSDIQAIFGLVGTQASGPDDPADLNGDGLITINDARGCVLQCTNPRCAPNPI